MYPYPELLPLLACPLDVPSYLALVAPLRSTINPFSFLFWKAAATTYWYQLPLLRYTVCPFCQGGYRAPLDLHTLWGWSPSSRLVNVPYGPDTSSFQKCSHYLGVHIFLHLHAHVPEGTYYSTTSGEVPFLTKHLFAHADIQTKAVLAAVPVCRIVEDAFVPTYTAFWLAYFSDSPKQVTHRQYVSDNEKYGHDPEYFPSLIPQPSTSDGMNIPVAETPYMAYDLARWCREGHLGWLDVTQPDLPLRIGAGMVLPDVYTDIQGDRRSYTYRNGVKGMT